ncbi:MAG: hypothetical protein ANABAC_1709 [Anaerolineae bacterium]|jgi:hypothetical protein|nr:MAG: hypothetical protein ANABAC_1709 [Anaerolineae bacterium]
MQLLKLWFVAKVHKAVRASPAKEGVRRLFCPIKAQPLFDSTARR